MSSLRSINIAFFVALLASALVLGPALAHLFELPNKIGLSRDDYFIVQKPIVAGTSSLGCCSYRSRRWWRRRTSHGSSDAC
jgi:hypothetical protein